MTLARRLGVQFSILIACLALTAIVGFWGVAGVRQDFSVALRNYERLRDLYQVGFHLQSARLALGLSFPDPTQARIETRRALALFDQQAPALTESFAREVQETRHALATAAKMAEAARPSVRLVDAPLATLNTLVDALRLQIQDAQRTADARTTRTALLLGLAAGVAMVISVLTGWRQFRAVLVPLGAIADGTRRVAAGGFDEPLQLPRADEEFARVAADFNAMAERLRTTYNGLQSRVESATRSALQSERMAGVGLLAAGVAHEINNPLSIITGRLELLQADLALSEPHRRQLAIALDEAFRCKQIIDRLLLLSRGPSGQRSLVSLTDLTRAVVASVRSLPAIASRSISVESSTDVRVCIDEGEIRQVMLNLLINAIQFTSDHGQITVAVQRIGSHAECTISDDGVGMEPATLDRLFEPFFSPPTVARRGTGLGLAISKAIVESHAGTLEAHSDGIGAGSRFVVRLAIADDGAAT